MTVLRDLPHEEGQRPEPRDWYRLYYAALAVLTLVALAGLAFAGAR